MKVRDIQNYFSGSGVTPFTAKSYAPAASNQILKSSGAIPNLSVFNSGSDNAFSIAFWLNYTNNGGVQGAVTLTGSSDIFVLEMNANPDDRLFFVLIDSGGSTVKLIQSLSAIPSGEWHHWCITYTPGQFPKIYKDAVLETGNTTLDTGYTHAATLGGSPTMAIGGLWDSTRQATGSKFNEAGWFNKALSAAEVLAVYRTWSLNNISFVSNLVAYYRFQDTYSSHFIDSSTSGYNVSSTSTPTVLSEEGDRLAVYNDGDSTSVFAGEPGSNNNWADVLKAYLDPLLTTPQGRTTKRVNVAVPSQTQATMLSNLNANILVFKPDIVIMMSSLNDIGEYDSSTLYANVKAYVDACLAVSLPQNSNGIQVVLSNDNLAFQLLGTLPRAYAKQVGAAGIYNQVYSDNYASNPNVHFVDMFAVYDALGGHNNPDSVALAAKLNADQIHPNAIGYALHSSTINPTILTACQRACLNHK